MKKRLAVVGMAVVALVGGLLVRVGGAAPPPTTARAAGLDLSAFSPERPGSPLRLLFIHHSCGGQLFADPGPVKERASCVLVTDPNGGGLRSLLEKDGYEVHEASYGSEIGEKTDLFDWRSKFSTQMDKVLTVSFNDEHYPDDRKNQIVVFKSCYPNSRFVGEGAAPGDAAGPDLTLWNAKATMATLLEHFDKQPNVLFVYMTAPPLAERGARGERLYKYVFKKMRGQPTTAEAEEREAQLAREFNNWVKSPDGWLKGYKRANVAVFDYYDALTEHGASNHSRFPNDDGDNHPTRAGNERAAAEFLPFLNRVVRRAQLVH